jgi:hypothetical protein
VRGPAGPWAPCGLFSCHANTGPVPAGLGAAAAPRGAIRGQRGAPGAAPGTAPPGGGSSSPRGVLTGAAAAAETPKRGARAVSERAGAAPRGRHAARSAGTRTGRHGWAWLWPMPHRRPGTTWRAEVWREVSRKPRRSSGVGSGQCWDTGNRRAVRGFPSRRPAVRGAGNAAAKGGTSGGHSSRVQRVKARHAVGRACTSVHRPLALCRASLHGRPRIS